MRQTFLVIGLIWVSVAQAVAQGAPLVFSTVDRPPFSIATPVGHEGFSIDLMQAIADELGREVRFVTQDSFSSMLSSVESGAVDGAIANISITAAREEVMDFSQPIFASGVQVMVRGDRSQNPFARAIFSADVGLAVLAALGMLFGAGMLMWVFERKAQPYFDRPGRDAMFPAFWWALNLVVNGGFEERMPRSVAGRIFAPILVVGSLFLVSIFVASITASVTVDAINGTINSINDLQGRRVATVDGSTSASFLSARSLTHIGYSNPTEMLEAFEQERVDAVVFDAPILAHYVQNHAQDTAHLLDGSFQPENYGIALPTDSELREPINQALLRLRESSVYSAIIEEWFGVGYRN